ncbi:MAG: helix-turn-helix transcriptional regulator [Bacteroidales bacterium]|nr:helix-turn-helix transcriptional regulator [Bacteroidales bacterium]HPO64884.1 helix-turn-helix transcriptional regulator [Bacteroidales bacterium]
MKDRIRKFLIQEGISPSQFADEIGVQRSAISHILSGRNNPSYEIITKILNRYKRLNPDWLLLGNGSMYRSDATNTISSDVGLQSATPTPPMEKVSGEVDNLLNSQSNPAVLEDEMHDQLSNVTNVNKPIERIIILYTDKTFEVFNRRN